MMLTSRAADRWLSFIWLLPVLTSFFFLTAPVRAATNSVEVIVAQGTVEVARGGQSAWDLVSTNLPYRQLNPGDQIRTKEHSRATIRLSDLTLIELGPNAHLELLRPEDRSPGFSLSRGLLRLFHRGSPGDFYFRTPTASPVIRGTEFMLDVAADGSTRLDLLEGEAALTNNLGTLDLKSGDAALALSGSAPTRTAAPEATTVIQWCLYYPAVLHPDELLLSAQERSALADSIAAYRRGDLVEALAKYPPDRQPTSAHEKIYRAALLLAVGDVAGAEDLLKSLDDADERARLLAAALRTLVAAVKFQPHPTVEPTSDAAPLASSLLAESYYRQSRFQLDAALDLARSASLQAPDSAFGLAWARVAELEFSLGHTPEALEAADAALRVSPRLAQAMVVKGFILAAQNRTAPALAQFEDAIATDGKLGDAWLGRGLCRIRQGHTSEGAADLLVAAAQEPNRALLRSYLGKAFQDTGNTTRAAAELARAKQLDPNDPTAWLYSALVNQQQNRVNEAIHDLEYSQELNDNRQLYRSRLLLDQDRAVRQANLASVYQDAGLFDQSTREAARAVSSDYANPSAHLFLANSYAQLSEPISINLRYETVALSEYLVAQLLAPVSGSALSPYVSQQEYSRLFQRDGLGLSSATEYRSDLDQWRQRGVQYGAYKNMDYALDAYYATQNGNRPNNDFELLTLSAATRVQLSPDDTVFVEAVRTEFESGDLRQFYDQARSDPFLRINESQEPNVFAGYHHVWGPGSHTLLLAALLQDDFRLHTDTNQIPTFRRNPAGNIIGQLIPEFSQFRENLHSDFIAGSVELQQILQSSDNTLIVGGRYQHGEVETTATLAQVPSFSSVTFPSGTQSVNTDLQRAVVYGYDYWEAIDQLWLIGGASFDWISYPKNIDLPPLSSDQVEKHLVSPKVGLIWQPVTNTVLRGAYTRSLGGLYYDQSVRLEPAQVAGFNQAFRSLIPESIEGPVPGAEFETAGLDFSWRLPTDTYLGLGCEWLRADASRSIGSFDSAVFPPLAQPANTLEQLDFNEKSLAANVNQLIGRDWSLGLRYRISQAELSRRLPNVPVSVVPSASQKRSAVLQQLGLLVMFTHPSGFFAELEPQWWLQDNRSLPTEQFWQLNAFVGWRFARRRAELVVGGLNLTGQDYKLNPLNLHPELPRERTLQVSFNFNF
jgi:tetratricopeptide (TPR) repeat protein